MIWQCFVKVINKNLIFSVWEWGGIAAYGFDIIAGVCHLLPAVCLRLVHSCGEEEIIENRCVYQAGT